MRYLSILLITTLFACSPSEEVSVKFFQKLDKEITANSKAYATLEEASTTIGHRLTGSENGAKAEEYVFKKLKSYGFEDVQYQEFEVDAWSRGSVQLTVNIDGEVSTLPVVSLGMSPEHALVAADIAFLGNGLAEDYDSVDVTGKVVLAYISLLPGTKEGKHNLHRSEKTALAIDHGAIGVILFNQVEGGVLLTGTASVTGKILDIPAMCIGLEDGMMLKEQIENGKNVKAAINMTNVSGPIKARNIIATLQGTELPTEKIVLGGHLDSWDLATGAIDNGIGSFSVLDIARSFKANKLQPKRTVKFVLFMGEEQGLLGSKYLVSQAIENGNIANIKAMMNLDMTGNPIGINASGKDVDSLFFQQLGEHIQQVDSSYQNKFSSRAGLHSDHQPFMLEGVPIVSLHSNMERSIYNCYHADCDDFGLVKQVDITNNVRFGTMILYSVANAETLPFARMNSEQTKAFMIENDLEEKLRIGGDWKWE
ncbi:MAG: M20/M25/M40 family metallo-hydrolase [Cyclobacteriaceae bacterium]|nr:M20/M25/M40 family metallo-hydrolase [Cyclobacteriaceae bacterium]